MSEPELLLDSNIRLWVVLPIVFITFFVGMIRHYVSILLQSDKKLTREQVSDSQVLIRSRVLRENGKYIPKQSFLTRKYFFNNPEDGFFKKTKRKVVPPSPMTDPTMLTDMMKGNVTNVLPMILIGGWINMTFSGFVTRGSCVEDDERNTSEHAGSSESILNMQDSEDYPPSRSPSFSIVSELSANSSVSVTSCMSHSQSTSPVAKRKKKIYHPEISL
ncbi:ER membrane protein complex subunit 3 isoform X4 [Caretta caretta]|uniref:ER membrane protein complex subunit 3 isoform X4 n=1 Tax=Caretta caretta TaxID=8467 RepID=UPI0020945340|nr:ER membrane protein complex subunit 3 isoform X4 [Caretta caretta]